ncbi:facilitated trehalose transporter Tret1-like [Melanaphis sacchari]|uniref:facilitated trehalose transporter Tret1-like n=1 Tax=Melanaphis sacchari TaxID=742174 RepID=UPI000DC13024|nr:facilitated trehalose transporter Tret1-like [Melanaphis sacchari]
MDRGVFGVRIRECRGYRNEGTGFVGFKLMRNRPKHNTTGRLGLMFPVIMAAGVVISDVFGPFQQYDHQQPFKISFNVFCYSIVILHVIGLCFIPKSPYSSPSNFFQHYYRNDDFSYIDYCGRFRRNLSWHIFDAFSCSVDRRALLISVGCMFFQQMCGINVMLPYMICIMKMAGIHVDPKTVFITLEIIQVITMSIAIIIIDYKGRRILLISSAVIMCLCLAGLEFCITIQMQLSVTTFSNLTMILITFFILAYSLGFGPVPWVIMGEIFSTKVKPYGISLTTAIHWLMVLAGIYFPYELTKFLEIDYFFLVYFVLCLFGALFAWWFVVETKQISLSRVQWEIDASLGIISYIPL